MKLLSKSFIVTIDEKTGTPTELKSEFDSYLMNWMRSDMQWGSVIGFNVVKTRGREGGISVTCESADKPLSLVIDRYVRDERYYEEYTFTNVSDCLVSISNDDIGIVFAYNDLFDKKDNMLFTRCNSHVWCSLDVCTIESVKLDGKKPYLIQRATEGSFSGYGLLCDISAASNASHDRGSIVLYAKENVIGARDTLRVAFEFYLSEVREPFSFAEADRYSGFVGDEFSISVNFHEPVTSASLEADGKNIPISIKGNTCHGSVSFDTVGEKKILCAVNGIKTAVFLNVLCPIDSIFKKRVAFITQKQQYVGEDPRLFGAYLIYDREVQKIFYNKDFPDHNSARERLAMGTLVAASLRANYDEKTAESLKKHREFIEREIVNISDGYVKNDIDDDTRRLYNFPWASTYYLEWYLFSKDKECLLTSFRILHKYYELGGKELESPCIEAYRILEHLKEEGLDWEYSILKEDFISHADSIYQRRTKSTSPEVSCANGMMNLMSTFLLQAYLITKDKKYVSCIEDLLKISESFYAFEPDYRMYGIALRYWDMYWFGKDKAYGDTYPQWLSALTAQMYYYLDLALGTDHSRLIRENLLSNCSLCQPDGFSACGYLYPKKVTVFSSVPNKTNPNRPLGVWIGESYDKFANDQDWSMYYAIKYLFSS